MCEEELNGSPQQFLRTVVPHQRALIGEIPVADLWSTSLSATNEVPILIYHVHVELYSSQSVLVPVQSKPVEFCLRGESSRQERPTEGVLGMMLDTFTRVQGKFVLMWRSYLDIQILS